MCAGGGGIVNKSIRVTDHAVLRYLERVGGFDIETLRRQIAHRMTLPAALGVHTVIIDGHRYVVKDLGREVVVVTVLEKGDLALHGALEP